jgi:hypothetical protein
MFVGLVSASDPSLGQAAQTNSLTQKESKKIVETVTLSYTANQKEYGDLLILFRRAGINLTNNSKVKKKKNWLKEIKFQLIHPQGLNFKLRITGFHELQFQFVFDEYGRIQYFTYRINNEAVYQHIDMDTKGYKTYVCFDTGIVQEGETNNEIERFN